MSISSRRARVMAGQCVLSGPAQRSASQDVFAGLGHAGRMVDEVCLMTMTEVLVRRAWRDLTRHHDTKHFSASGLLRTLTGLRQFA